MDGVAGSFQELYLCTLSTDQRSLFLAVEEGVLESVRELFNRSRSEIQEKYLDYVLLTIAVKKNKTSVVEFLLKSGCKTRIEEKTKFLYTPLYYAVEQNNNCIAVDLIKNGASIHDTDVNEISPFEFVVRNKKFYLIDTILGNLDFIQNFHGLNPHSRNDTALFHMACYQGYSQAIRKFVECGFSVNSCSNFDEEIWRGFTPMHFIVKDHRLWSIEHLAKSLLEHDVDLSAQDKMDRTALHIAFRNNFDDVSRCPSHSSLGSNLSQKWFCNIIQKKFSNPVDRYGLSHFHILCFGMFICEDSKYLEALQIFLDNGVDINRPVSLEDNDYPGQTALHFATVNPRFDVIKLLLDNGADFKSTDKEGMTPLHVACKHLLYKSNGDFDSRSKEMAERLNVVLLLLEQGADIDAKDLKGTTPLHCAFYSRQGDETFIRQLLSKSHLNDNFTDAYGLSYLHIACVTDLSVVKILMDLGALPYSYLHSDSKFKPGYSAFHLAILFNKLEIVQYLLEHGADPNIRVDDESKATPLHIACAYELNEFYDLENWIKNADISAAAQSYQTDKIRIVESLLKYGASIDERDSSGITPLFSSCRVSSIRSSYKFGIFEYAERMKVIKQIYSGQLEMIQLLLKNDADIFSCVDDGGSILHFITRQDSCHQRKCIARIMLKQGADIDAVDEEGLTPLHLELKNAKIRKKDSLVKLFWDNFASIGIKSVDGNTPLHFAAQYCYSSAETLPLLLGDNIEDVDLNAQNNNGDTALHIASKLGNAHDVITLLMESADVNIENSDGVLPLDHFCNRLIEIIPNCCNSDPAAQDLYDVVLHLKKLEKINIPICKRVEESLDALLKLKPSIIDDVNNEIEEELKRLKSTMIDRYTSLYDLLFKDINSMARYAHNETLSNIIVSKKFSIDFSLYGERLCKRKNAGARRNEVLEPAIEALRFILQVRLPDCCVQHVLQYLNEDDLSNLLQSRFSESTRERFCQCQHSPPPDES